MVVVVEGFGLRWMGWFLGGGGGGCAFEEGLSTLRGAGLFLAKLRGVGEGSWRGPVGSRGWGFGGEEVGVGDEGAPGCAWRPRCRGGETHSKV